MIDENILLIKEAKAGNNEKFDFLINSNVRTNLEYSKKILW